MSSYTCGVKYRARRPVRDMEVWLESHCSGDWKVILAGFDDSDPKGIVNELEIYFEKPADRDAFKTTFLKKG